MDYYFCQVVDSSYSWVKRRVKVLRRKAPLGQHTDAKRLRPRYYLTFFLA